jgi:hypothetical protein
VRPTGVPGRELDVLFALQLEEIAQRRAQDRRAALTELSRRLSTAFAPPVRQQPLNWISNVIGTYVYTNCY